MEGPLHRLALIGGCAALMTAAAVLPGQTQHTGEALQASTTVGIDANPSGNSATSLGDIDQCVSVATGTTFDIDIFVTDVNDLAGWQAAFIYDPSVVIVADAKLDLFLTADPGSRITDLSEPRPDQDGLYAFAAIDLIQPEGESGSGVLATVSLQAMASGASTLALERVILGNSSANPIGDIDGDQFFDGPVYSAQVAVDQSCLVAPPPTPTAEPTLIPRPTPTATPVILATPTPTLPATQVARPPSPTPAGQLTPTPLPHEGEEGDTFPWALVAAASAGGVAAALALGLALRHLLRSSR